MKIELPVLKQEIVNGNLVETESMSIFELDTSVYSQERWEQHFPRLAERESLFNYIGRIKAAKASGNVEIACLIKALFCFLESSDVPSYKEFAQMFNLSNSDYTNRLISKLTKMLDAILGGSAVKN